MNLPEVAIATALAWGAGLRAYAVIVLGASGFMTAVEFFADKVPWLDSVWDAVHSFIRIPAGAALAAAVFGDSGAAVALAAAILGGTLSAGVHFTKTGTRAAINTSPEPLSNWSASLAEDAMVPAGLWLAASHPIVFFVLLLVFIVLAALLARAVWRGLKTVFSR